MKEAWLCNNISEVRKVEDYASERGLRWAEELL